MCAASAAAVLLDAGTPGRQRASLGYGRAWPYALLAVTVTLLGVWTQRRVPRNRVALLLEVTGLSWGLNALAQAWASYAVRPGGVLPLAGWSIWCVNQLGALLVLPLPLLLILYPTGRLPGGRTGGLARTSLTLVALLPVVGLFVPADLTFDPHRLLPPAAAGLDLDKTGLPLLRAGGLPLLSGAAVLAAVGMFLALAVVVARRHEATGLDRQRFDWLLWAAVVDVLVVGVALTVKAVPATTAGVVTAVAVTAGAVAVGVAQPSLVDIDRLLSATLVHSALTVAVLLVDAAVVGVGGALVGDRLQQRDVLLLVLLVVALGYGPAREALRQAVRRLLLGRRDDPYSVVSTLASRLEGAASPQDQLETVAAAVAEAFRVSFVAVEVLAPDGRRVVASHGVAPASTHVLPITFRGELVGSLVLPQLGVRARLSPRDEALLADVVRQVAVATRSSQLAEELQAIREQLVLGREEERRRIRRDLHDGLGPTLASVVLRIDHARNLTGRSPERADALLCSARDDVSEVLADVRRLVHDLRPPALDDLGLVAALRLQAARLASGALRIDVLAAGLPDLPAAVEVAVYRIVSEALANVARHAGATAGCVRVEVLPGDPPVLSISVTDDGYGIDADAVAGVGLVSLRERAAELGGRSEVLRRPGGGTQVHAELPLERGQRA